MYLIAIYGSPRENGNSDILLDEALKGVSEYEKIFVRELNIQPCSGCRSCDTTGKCIIKDDMTTIYKKLEICNRLIVSSPIYFCGLPAQLKALIDRSQCYWARKYLLKLKVENQKLKSRKLGVFIAVSATKNRKLFLGAKYTIKYFFDVYNVRYFDELIVTGIDKKGEVLKSEFALKKAYQLGKILVR